MDYQTANGKLTGRNHDSRKLGNNTYLVRRNDGKIAITLHATDIITLSPSGDITLNSGGWRTVTTKSRLNEYAPVAIGQRNGQWYMLKNDGSGWVDVCMFADGITVHADGSITGGEPLTVAAKNLSLRRKVQRYAAKYIEAFTVGLVPAPSNGDCWYCSMREVKTNQPLGEIHKDKDHILSHLDESYFVPSLLARAFEVMPHSAVMGWAIAGKWQPEKVGGTDFLQGFVVVQLQKMLSRYILRQLAQAS